MGGEFGSAYIGQLVAKQAMNEMLYGKSQSKKKSLVKILFKKIKR